MSGTTSSPYRSSLVLMVITKRVSGAEFEAQLLPCYQELTHELNLTAELRERVFSLDTESTGQI